MVFGQPTEGAEPLPSAFLWARWLQPRAVEPRRRPRHPALGFGVGGATIFAWLLSLQVGLDATKSFFYSGAPRSPRQPLMLLSIRIQAQQVAGWPRACPSWAAPPCSSARPSITSPGNITTLSFLAFADRAAVRPCGASAANLASKSRHLVEGRGDAVRTALTALDEREARRSSSFIVSSRSNPCPGQCFRRDRRVQRSQPHGRPRHEVRGLVVRDAPLMPTWDDGASS